MPLGGTVKLDHEDILSYEEFLRLILRGENLSSVRELLISAAV